MKLGTNTKAAISRIVDHLPYLNAEGTGVPTGAKDGLEEVRAKYAAAHTGTIGDPKFAAAKSWAEEQIEAALTVDNAPAKEAPKAEDEPAEEKKPAHKADHAHPKKH